MGATHAPDKPGAPTAWGARQPQTGKRPHTHSSHRRRSTEEGTAAPVASGGGWDAWVQEGLKLVAVVTGHPEGGLKAAESHLSKASENQTSEQKLNGREDTRRAEAGAAEEGRWQPPAGVAWAPRVPCRGMVSVITGTPALRLQDVLGGLEPGGPRPASTALLWGGGGEGTETLPPSLGVCAPQGRGLSAPGWGQEMGQPVMAQ